MSTHVFDFLLDVHAVPPLGPLKSKVLQEVGDSVICVVFISASCIDKYTHRTRLSVSTLRKLTQLLFAYLRKDAYAVRKGCDLCGRDI